MLDSLSCSFTSISFPTTSCSRTLIWVLSVMLDTSHYNKNQLYCILVCTCIKISECTYYGRGLKFKHLLDIWTKCLNDIQVSLTYPLFSSIFIFKLVVCFQIQAVSLVNIFCQIPCIFIVWQGFSGRIYGRDFNKGRHPAICRRFKRVKSSVRLLETKIFVH